MHHYQKTFVLLLVISTWFSAQGQKFKNNIHEYEVKLSVDSADLIDSANVVSADSMKAFLKPFGYRPLDINFNPVNNTILNPKEIYNNVSKATVIVSPAGRCGEVNSKGKECKRIHTYPASGYIIDSKGIIVTNYHVVNSYTTKYNKTSRDVLVVMLKDGTIFPVEEILSADKSNDLAIIKIDPKGKELVSLSIAPKDAEIGDPAYVVSHPKGYFYAFSSGMVTDKFSKINAGKYRNLMAISADFAAGSSGAPIIDKYGNVIGTVTYTKTLQHSDDPSKTQMILKATVPSSSLLNLIKQGNKPKS